MKLSVVIPAHNEERVIAGTLRAIRAQRPAVHEVIVVCNGCRDATAARARAGGARVVVTERRGVSLARNLGAAHATGDTLLFVDADVRLAAGLSAAIGAGRRRAPRHRGHGSGSARLPALRAALRGRRGDDPRAARRLQRADLLLGAAVRRGRRVPRGDPR